MKKPKVLFVYDHPKPEWWMDGLSRALDVLEEDFELERINLHDRTEVQVVDMMHCDFVLGWGAFGSHADMVINVPSTVKKGLCIAGNATPPEGANNYDVLFYETKWYRPQISFHPNIVHAFGVNTDIYSPTDLPVPIVWDHIGVGALANWKRWEKMIDKPGTKLVIGEYQDNNESESLEIARKLIRGGVMVSAPVNPFDLSNFYSWSRNCYIPADIQGGGERAILEARACGLQVEVEEDNPKLQEVAQWDPLPDHNWYAAQLKKGIMSCLEK